MHVCPIFLPINTPLCDSRFILVGVCFSAKSTSGPGKTVKSTPLFMLWDAYAIANSHWIVNPELTTGIFGPLGIPMEEYLFFIIIPIAAILTMEGVAAFMPTATRCYAAIKKAVSYFGIIKSGLIY